MVVTNGGRSKLGIDRYHESLNATGKLGLPRKNLTFLDYPQKVDSLFNENWDKNTPWNEDGTHNKDDFAYELNAPYTGVSLENDMEGVIGNFKPTIIIYPYSNDANPDHYGTSAFVEYTANKINYTGKRYSYPVHVTSIWPFPRSYFPQINLLPPSFLANQTQWLIFPLNITDEEIKYDAINSYKTQLESDPTYLRSFVRKNELFINYEQGNVWKKNFSMDYINQKGFPQMIFHDPVGDTLVKPPMDILYSTMSNLKLMDLTDVGFEVDRNITWISVKTDGGISKTGVYHFRVRSFENGIVKRADIKVQYGKAKYEMLASNSVNSAEPVKVKIEENVIVIGIPSNLFNSTKYMIAVEDEKNDQYLDRTGWYTVNLFG
jgi:LmbE family N-acetylglucosaminyl deacetylase